VFISLCVRLFVGRYWSDGQFNWKFMCGVLTCDFFSFRGTRSSKQDDGALEGEGSYRSVRHSFEHQRSDSVDTWLVLPSR